MQVFHMCTYTMRINRRVVYCGLKMQEKRLKRGTRCEEREKWVGDKRKRFKETKNDERVDELVRSRKKDIRVM